MTKYDPQVRRLLQLLRSLGIKSARPGIMVNFAGMKILKPGYYTTIRNIL